MSHRIEYLTIDGGTIIEYTDEVGFEHLLDDAKLGIITILNSNRYDSSSR
jgi:hypothetical protein